MENVTIKDEFERTKTSYENTLNELTEIKGDFEQERSKIKSLVSFQCQMKTNLTILRSDLTNQAKEIAELMNKNEQIEAENDALTKNVANSERQVGHLLKELASKEDDIEKNAVQTRRMVQHLEDTVEHRDQLVEDNAGLVDRLNLELVHTSELTMKYQAKLDEIAKLEAEQEILTSCLTAERGNLAVIEVEAENEYKAMEDKLQSKIADLEEEYMAKVEDFEALQEQAKYDEETVASLQGEILGMVENHKIELAEVRAEFAKKASDDIEGYKIQVEELESLRQTLQELFEGAKEEIIEVRLELDGKNEENLQLKEQLAEFTQTVETLLVMRDELTEAVEEITKDSKSIKLELEKSLEVNRTKDEQIQGLQSDLRTAEQEKNLNEILETENIRLQENVDELLEQNVNLTEELKTTKADLDEYENAVVELKQKIIIIKVNLKKIDGFLFELF